MESIAYKQGVKAAKMGIKLEDSALKSLHPQSERYEQFIAGYDSVEHMEDSEQHISEA